MVQALMHVLDLTGHVSSSKDEEGPRWIVPFTEETQNIQNRIS